ncbi:MAG: 2TM domain-containing protein [Leeuwenhoekiella sp.]
MTILFRELGKAFIVGTSIYLVFLIIYFFMGRPINLDENLLQDYGVNLIYTVILYMLNMLVFQYFWDNFKKRHFSTTHLTRAIAGGIGISILGIFICRLIEAIFIEKQAFSTFIAGERVQYYFVSFVISMVVTAIFYFFYYYKCKKEKQVKEQKIIARTASAQFDALKNQLDPHFLFNSLNVLTSLIEENPEHALHFTTSLSKVYRYVLEQKNKELVTVDEELAFAKTYMSLIKMRFEDSLIFTMPAQASNPEAKVVPLSLQLLLENAVKHNRVTPNDKLHIDIEEFDGFLQIKNNLQAKQIIKKSTGVGLQNIYQRYQLLTKKQVEVITTETEFIVKIPILTRQISKMYNTEAFLDDKKYFRAKKHVEALKGFYANFILYLISIPIFIGLNVFSSSFPWALFPILGWGMGVAFHGAEVYNWNPFLGRNWEERKIKALMDTDKSEV